MSSLMKERLIAAGVQVALICAGWYMLQWYAWVPLPMMGAVLLPLLFPYRFERIVEGLALIGVAVFFYFYGGSGYLRLCMLLGAVGFVMIAIGAWKLRGPRAAEG